MCILLNACHARKVTGYCTESDAVCLLIDPLIVDRLIYRS